MQYCYVECGHWWSDGIDRCAEKIAEGELEKCDRETWGITRARETRPGYCEQCYYPSPSDSGQDSSGQDSD